MTLWQNLDMSERIAAAQTTAANKNIEDRAVEKDWWVTAVLKALFMTPCSDYLLFKGLCIATHKPLNSRYSLQEVWKRAFKVMLTHQSFSTAYSGRCSPAAAC